jgi:hypothetical protein
LPELIDFAKGFLWQGAVGIFPRGRSVDTQIAELPKGFPFRIDRHASKLDPASSILLVRREGGAAASVWDP